MSVCKRSGGNIHVVNFTSSPSLVGIASPVNSHSFISPSLPFPRMHSFQQPNGRSWGGEWGGIQPVAEGPEVSPPRAAL